MTATLVDEALEAAGGLAAWRQADAWQATLSTGGLAFRTRGRPDLHQLHATVATFGQRVTLDRFPRPRYRATWDAGLTRIEQPDGRLLEQRTVTSWGRRWDDLDMAAFVGLALWTYASLPFVLIETGMKVEPLPQRRLRVRFPDSIQPTVPSNCSTSTTKDSSDGTTTPPSRSADGLAPPTTSHDTTGMTISGPAPVGVGSDGCRGRESGRSPLAEAL